jgi:hypothetical protein
MHSKSHALGDFVQLRRPKESSFHDPLKLFHQLALEAADEVPGKVAAL